MLAQSFVAESQLIHFARTSGFEDDVGFAYELEKDRVAVGRFDIESNAALVGVEMKKVKTLFRMRRIVFERRNAPRFIARRRLDLEHIGAHVGQELGAMETERSGDIEHPVAGQRAGSHNFLHENPQRKEATLIRRRFLLGRRDGVKARNSNLRVRRIAFGDEQRYRKMFKHICQRQYMIVAKSMPANGVAP